MGFRDDITLANDTNYAEAYFRVRENVQYDLIGKRVEFSLLTWKDKTARDANKQTLHGVPSIRKFIVTGDDFDEYFGDDVLQEAGKSLWKQCYAYALAHPDYENAVSIDPD